MDAVDAADLKTLALSRPPLTEETLQELMAYQRALIHAHAQGPGDLARAHEAALEKSKLKPRDIDLWSGVLREYCGKRWTARQLDVRKTQLEARKAERPLPPPDAAKLAALLKERSRVGDLSAMKLRYGAKAFALLQAHEEELLSLHERLRALSCF